MGIATMAEKGKKSSGRPDDKAKFDTSVKLRAGFKEALDEVAADLGLYPGELIEQRMGQLIRQEWKRILAEKLKRADNPE